MNLTMGKTNKIIKTCKYCGEEFDVKPHDLKIGGRKYCSLRCVGLAKKGKKFTEEHKKRISESHKGKRRTKETKEKISKTRKLRNIPVWNKGITGKNNPQWKGGAEKSKKREKEKNKKDLKYQINKRMKDSIKGYLKKGIKNGRSWKEFVDYDIIQLEKRLKKTMPNGYNWDDFLSGLLQIDHIIPISAFDFDKPEHLNFKRCWALENLRLLPKSENIRKKDKLIKSFQLGLKI